MVLPFGRRWSDPVVSGLTALGRVFSSMAWGYGVCPFGEKPSTVDRLLASVKEERGGALQRRAISCINRLARKTFTRSSADPSKLSWSLIVFQVWAGRWAA